MMDIKELKVTVGEVCEGYFNDAEEGVVGYDDRLDIRRSISASSSTRIISVTRLSALF